MTETDSKKQQETYKGLIENEVKTSFNLHKSSFKLDHKPTTLGDHIWKLKKKNTDFNTKWVIIKNVKPYARLHLHANKAVNRLIHVCSRLSFT